MCYSLVVKYCLAIPYLFSYKKRFFSFKTITETEVCLVTVTKTEVRLVDGSRSSGLVLKSKAHCIAEMHKTV